MTTAACGLLRGGGGATTSVNLANSSTTVDLYAVALANGYSGSGTARFTFVVPAGVTITGNPGNGTAGSPGIRTGTWPAGSHTLKLQISGKVYGGGGGGGYGSSTTSPTNGQAGGDGFYLEQDFTLEVKSGGELKGGGGGGCGGARVGPSSNFVGGDGGGGGAPYGVGGSGGSGSPDPDAEGASGATATLTAGGAGAGYGGAVGVAGDSISPKTGGAVGYAVRKNAKAFSYTNAGTIVGTIG